MTNALDNQVRSLIHALPDSSAEIAGLLEGEHIRGKLGTSHSCPLANYVKRHVPEATHVHASASAVSAGLLGEVFVFCPDAVATFIGEFDTGRYPNLVEET